MADNLRSTSLRFENGLRLLVSENQRLPLVTINAYVTAGADQNPARKAGLAELTSRLLEEGSASYSADQIAGAIENEGSSLSVFSSREMTGATFQGREASVETAVRVLREILVEPSFHSPQFEREKDRLLAEIAGIEDEPSVVAGNRFYRHVFAGTPFQYPFLGTIKSVSALGPEDVRWFHRTRFSPSNTWIVVVGAVRAEEIARRIELHLGSWQNDSFALDQAPEPRKQAKAVVDRILLDTEQLQIMFGHLGIDRINPDFHYLQVLDVMLGSGPGVTGRIPRVLRDELGLAYLTHCSLTASAGIYPGQFVVFLSTSPENRNHALQRLRSEIQSVIKGDFSRSELETAQDFLTGNFVFDFESNYNIARFLLSTELFGLGSDYPGRYPGIIRRVTRDDIVRVAGEYLDIENCTTVLVGPDS